MKAHLTQVWWHLTVTLAFEMWRQEDQDFNAILGYVRSFRERERERSWRWVWLHSVKD